MRILIVKISSLGDIVHSFAFINALSRSRPDIQIDYLAGDRYADIVKNVGGVRKVYQFKRAKWGKDWWRLSVLKEMLSLITEIRKEKYDICLDMQGLLRSGLITLFSGASERAGFADAREGSRLMYNRPIDAGAMTHAADKLLKALKIFGVAVPKKPDFSFSIPRDTGKNVSELLASAGIKGKYLVFHIGARWKTKLWPEEFWQTVAEDIEKETEFSILFTGSADDYGMVERVIGSGGNRLFNFAGRVNLTELAVVLKGAELMLTVDSGPMHIAAAFGTPLAAIFCSTSPEKTGPHSQGLVKLFQPVAACAPCFKRECAQNAECAGETSPSLVKSTIFDIIRG